MMFRIRRVLSLTVHTPIPLRTRIGFTGFILTSRCLAFWTFLHNSILAHLFRHSGENKNNKTFFCFGYNLFALHERVYLNENSDSSYILPSSHIWSDHLCRATCAGLRQTRTSSDSDDLAI